VPRYTQETFSRPDRSRHTAALATMTLAHAALGQPVTITHVGGDRAFRRRLMELGLVPGTRVELVGVAPLGDPLELLVRGCSLSIRRGQALFVSVAHESQDSPCGQTDDRTRLRACSGGCGAVACGPKSSM
jgi:ferrous iron transport protein A